MDMKPVNKNQIGTIIGVVFSALFVTTVIWWSNREPSSKILQPTQNIAFTKNYPNNSEFINELALLKAEGKLKEENETHIRNTIKKVSPLLAIPSPLLYCLFFQESRLNHLSGVNSTDTTLGLGQFSYYSFFEVNNHLSKFTPKNLLAMKQILGADVRPIEPNEKDLTHLSSYFHIPTAVVASSIFLNNRFLHLTNIIKKRELNYDTNLMWVFSAMAYNKGTRSVLSLWNETENVRGKDGLIALITSPKVFFSSLTSEPFLYNSLRRIWPESEAASYSKEWAIHLRNIAKCSVDIEQGGEL